ncbi:tyrosine-protein phosphatase [Rhodococcus globerulus]|uniref:tyrosine-protein phosphatase n=1 Tax=Rhodococcus globerulus TaxID=33008 RepID=UPI000AFFD178|nr:tyrosine-protein phosphatase [Rhodococcus globerulus]
MTGLSVSTTVRKNRLAVTLAVAGALVFAGSTVAVADPTGALGFGSSALGSSQELVAPTPRLASVDNFRDVAGDGAGYRGVGGVQMNRGVFYRSNALLPNDADLAALDGLGITAVYDLRTEPEIVGKEDRLPAKATYTWLPTLSGNLGGISGKLKSPADAVAFMQDLNRSFVTDAAVRGSFSTLFNSLADTSGAQIVHCTSGKDRTGWTSALLQSMVGVPWDTIMADYLLTNEYSRLSIDRQLAGAAAASGPEMAAIYSPILHVDASYLEAGFAQLEADYGTVYNYLLTGLNLSPQTIAVLVNKLVG